MRLHSAAIVTQLTVHLRTTDDMYMDACMRYARQTDDQSYLASNGSSNGHDGTPVLFETALTLAAYQALRKAVVTADNVGDLRTCLLEDNSAHTA